MNDLAFSVLGDPKSAGSKRAFKHPHTGRIIVTDANKNAAQWKREVRLAASAAWDESEGVGATPFDGPVVVTFSFFRARPKGHYGARGLLDSAPAYPITRPDVDKLSRAVMDALTGVVWRDDAQVVAKAATKDFGEPARVEVEVVPMLSEQGALDILHAA